MSDKNPKLAVQALLESDDKPHEAVLHPITVARYALLEAVDSPLLVGYAKNTLELIPTLYILAMPTSKLKGYNISNINELKDKAIDWADELDDLSYVSKLISEAVQKLKDLSATSPKSSKKA